MFMRPIPLDLGVAAIVLRDSKILLVQEAQGPHEGRWGLPKGMSILVSSQQVL